MKRFLTLASLVLALTLVTGTAAHAKGNKGDKPNKADKAAKRDPNSVAGLVQKVDGNTLTLKGHGKKAAEVTVTTDAATKIRVNGKPGTLADIKPGMRVVATPNTGTATKVVANTPKKDKNGPTPDKSDAK
jgi:hypothetical protein